MPGIRIEGLTKHYRKGAAPAVSAIDLEVRDGEFMVLVGPSGCGKSTLMRMLAGIEEVSAGRILIGERDVTHVDPRKRDVAMVFQNYALYPHLSVRQNLGFGLKLRGSERSDIARRVDDPAVHAVVIGVVAHRPDPVGDRDPGHRYGDVDRSADEHDRREKCSLLGGCVLAFAHALAQGPRRTR